jgi:16S rRNA (cytosine967-C5)-methyltransferase
MCLAQVLDCEIAKLGIGTLRRNPDVKLFLTSEKVERLVYLQREIFDKVEPRLRKDGKLVYMSCSYLAEENED